ncbi:MAG TPA: immunoglobulin domain-containing protein [Verrucomicrobiae bacterium]|jgi:fructan beta-fructosidase|nr:immunoglobulin domain-containing protein [Verrucomicrobiae bacterium]
MFLAALLPIGAGLSFVPAAQAATGPLAYEGFNYPAGSSLNGQSGGTGWSNAWVDVSENLGETANASGLSAGSNAPAGFDNRSAGNAAHINSSSRCGRWLDRSPTGSFAQAGYLNANGDIGASGKTLYLSFLQQPTSTAQFYEFEFHRGDLSDPGRIGGIGNDLPNATTVNFRTPDGVQTPLGLGNTNVNFYVVRIDYKTGNDDVYIYRNPTGYSESDNDPVLTMLSAGDLSFDGISLAAYLNGVTVNNDEIRLGETWTSVLGNPPDFTLQPTNQAAYVGQNLSFNASAQSSQPLNYQWYRGSDPLALQTNTDLTLSNAQLADAGHYSVTASNALGVVTSAMATLTVQTISAVISTPQSVTVGTGSNLVISASVGGASPVTLQWYRDDTAIDGATNATYSANDVDVFSAGQYELVASNASGVVTSSVVNVSPNFGGLLAYEGFNYGQSSSDIGGANGGFGWSGAWLNLGGGASTSYSNNLVAAGNAPAGYDAHSLAGYLFQPISSRKARYLDCSPTGTFAQHGYIDGNGNIGADGSRLYISFLQQPSDLVQFYEFELKRDDLGDGGRIGGIGNDTGDTHAHLRIESPAGGASTFYDLGPGSTGVNFYVMRIDYHTAGDTVIVYRNPTSVTEPAAPTVAVSNVADMSFDGISFGAFLNNITVSHDEVRVGQTWADVLGNTVSQLRLSQRTGNTSNLLLAASPNYTYQLQAATNLNGPWSNIGTVAASSLGIGRFVETNSTSVERFYRATNESGWSASPTTSGVIADFEGATYGNWTVTGTAFGSGPAQGALSGQQPVSGYIGSGLVDSYLNGDGSTGTLTSPPFIITQPYLNFLIGGGSLPGQACMNLIISNAVVATATGANSETLTPRQWDVSAYVGQTATLQIVDSATGGWGHVLVDQIAFADTAFPSLSRSLMLTNSLLNLPVKNSAPMKRVTITVGGKTVRDFNIKLADGAPDWWSFVDVSEFQGQTANITVNALTPGSTGLSSIVQTNGIVGATNLYQETLRPQMHFSTQRGWLNDANGMFYYNGQYHLYYQHDPFNWDGSGQKWWGHAVSADMVNWRELPEGIYSHSYGDDVWSGSAVVDTANTGGFKAGTNDAIVAAFYSTGRGECITYSTDGGQSFIDYSNNPVVTHAGTGRDPHLFWYAPSNYWVMAVYDDSGGNGVQFYSTPDFRHWTFRSKIYNGFFECPDMFQLPVDGNSNNTMWLLNDASTGYQLGQFDGVTFTPSTGKLPGNAGRGYYASQTFTSMAPGDNRKVRIGWAQLSMPGMPFNESMFFPTALTLKTIGGNVRLCSQPGGEITNDCVNTYSWTNLTLNPGYNPLSGIRGQLFDVQAQFTPDSASSINFTLCGVTISYSPTTQQISCNGDTQSLPPVNGTVSLEIICDRQTVEIFGNGGQLYMPIAGTGYNAANELLSLASQGDSTVFQSLKVNKLKSIWPVFNQ